MIRPLLGPAALGSIALFLAACEKPSAPTTATPAPAATPAPSSAPDATYTVHGQVERLPGPDGPLVVHHEAIPSFVGKDGKVTGMREMTMDFSTLAAGVSTEGLREGDPVALTFEVRWNADPRMRVVKLEPLPPGTPLHFGGSGTQAPPDDGK